jgi:IclR family acetate operon transcriptional repressor
MRKLMEDSGESVNLAVLDDGAVVYLTQVECHEMMRALARPGGRAPIHCSGVGKALLSALPKVEVDSILARHGLALHTRKTVTDPVELKRALEDARQQRFALDDEEQVLGMRCVAAVIYDEYAYPLAAISLSGPTARITDRRIDGLGMLAVRAADEITDKIGGRRPG